MKYLKVTGILLVLVVAGLGIKLTEKVQGTSTNTENEMSNFRDDLKSEVRDLSGFNKIDIGGTVSADITVGENFSVIVEAKESVLPKLITKVENNTLKVKFEKDWWKNSKSRNTKAKVTISLPVLDDLDVSGASNADVTGINNEKLTLDISGASSVTIEGSAREIFVDLSGASNLKANNLFSEVAEMDLSGASSAKVNVASKLRVDASGASSVRYAGNPQVQKDTSGASSVKGQ